MSKEKEEYYKIMATVELLIPVGSVPVELFLKEAGKKNALKIMEKVADGEIDVDITKYFVSELEREAVKVKSGIFNNLAFGWITKVVGYKIEEYEMDE